VRRRADIEDEVRLLAQMHEVAITARCFVASLEKASATAALGSAVGEWRRLPSAARIILSLIRLQLHPVGISDFAHQPIHRVRLKAS